jgi:hypothetical protein
VSFHPKVYLFDFQDESIAIIGSSNTTEGGLWTNLEISVLVRARRKADADFINELEAVWRAYSTPAPPFEPAHLRQITEELLRNLAVRYGPERRQAPNPLAEGLPRPTIRRPGIGETTARRTPRGERRRPSTLLMEILEETRDSQVQIPVNVLTGFFGVARNRNARIILRQVRNGRTISERVRPIVHLRHNNTHRIEIDAVKGLPRPVIARFDEDPDRTGVFSYVIHAQGTRGFQQLNALLNRRGRQTRRGSKRYLLLP